MSVSQPGHRAGQPTGLHVATVAYDGVLWETYLEFVEDPRRGPSFRARLRFQRAAPDGTSVTAETAVIIIEDSHEEAVAKVRAMDDRQLQGMLRSALPEGSS
jgi:hypothetical protein